MSCCGNCQCATKEQAYRDAIADAIIALWDHDRAKALKLLSDIIKEKDAPRYHEAPV